MKKSLAAKRRFARYMRGDPTAGEAAFWELVRAEALGYRFRRQITLWGYIVDFYCPSLRLAIEVDGSVHRLPERIAADEVRERALFERRIVMLRFENFDVLEAPNVVLLRLVDEMRRAELALKGVGFASKVCSGEGESKPVVKVVACASLEKQSAIPRPAAPLAPISFSRGLCTTLADLAQLPAHHRITRAEYEVFLREVVKLSRQRSLNLTIEDRPMYERAADAKYRLEEYLARRKRQGSENSTVRKQQA